MFAPAFLYQPPSPQGAAPKIGLIGCGGITEHHLKAYKAAGWEVAAFYDANPAAAESRRKEFYPQARVCSSVAEMLEDCEIQVVDIATHPKVRAELIEQAIAAGKHILSQKPFAADLATGERLVSLARDAGVKMAVNQNGRWAPYFSYMRHAVRSGLIGEVGEVHNRHGPGLNSMELETIRAGRDCASVRGGGGDLIEAYFTLFRLFLSLFTIFPGSHFPFGMRFSLCRIDH